MSIESTPLGKGTLTKLGSGSYGDVWRCRYASNNNARPSTVAIKCAESADSTEGIDDTSLLEVSILRMLSERPDNVNIVNIFKSKASREDGISKVWFDMPCYDRDLNSYMKSETENTRLGITHKCLSEIGTAIAYIHSRGIIHGDISPANIFLKLGTDYRYSFYLGDFGLSYPVGVRLVQSSDIPKVNQRFNVYADAFKSPEVFEKRPYSVKADVWAFGVTLLSLVCGGYMKRVDLMTDIGNIEDIVKTYTDINLNLSENKKLIGYITKMLIVKQNVRKYIHEILPFIPEYISTPYYKQSVVHDTIDSKIVEEIKMLCKKLEFCSRTEEVSVNLVSRYLSQNKATNRVVETLVIITCIWMVHKMIEFKYVNISTIFDRSGIRFKNIELVILMEKKIFNSLNGNML